LIDVDDDKLETVRKLLGTSTLKATVNGALDEVLALDQRRQALLAE
jgi:Arc/MetJ family transcription regulator